MWLGMWAAAGAAGAVAQTTRTATGALTDTAETIVPLDSTCVPDFLQQSDALSFIGQ